MTAKKQIRVKNVVERLQAQLIAGTKTKFVEEITETVVSDGQTHVGSGVMIPKFKTIISKTSGYKPVPLMPTDMLRINNEIKICKAKLGLTA